MRRIITAVLIVCFALSLTGCDALQRKFTRKKKETKPIPKLYQVKKYDVKPSTALYSKHFAYWQSWMSELLQDLGQSQKRDLRSVNEALSQLHDMQRILVDVKAAELGKQIANIERAKNIIEREQLSQFNRSQVLMTIERADRTIKSEFSVKKIKDYVRESFDESTPSKGITPVAVSQSAPIAASADTK